MIHYEFDAYLVKDPKTGEGETLSKTFQNPEDPIKARNEAIAHHDQTIENLESEFNTKIDKFLKANTGDRFTDEAFFLSVKLVIDDPKSPVWDGLDIEEREPLILPLGRENIEQAIQETIEDGTINSREEFEVQPEMFEFPIYGKGDIMYVPRDYMLLGALSIEREIYEKMGYNTEEKETEVKSAGQGTYKILDLPWNWDEIKREAEGEKEDEQEAILPEELRNSGKNGIIYETIKDKELDLIRSLSSLLNTTGGAIVVGADQEGNIQREVDGSRKEEHSEIVNLSKLVKDHLGKEAEPFIHPEYRQKGNGEYLLIKVSKSSTPLVVSNNGEQEFWIRGIAGNEKLDLNEAVEWVQKNF
jgi:hypothetical protein